MTVPAPARGPRGPARVSTGDPLRDQFLKIFVRSFKRAEKAGAGKGRVVYRDAARVYHDLCGAPWAQGVIYPDMVHLVRTFLRETGLGGGAQAQVIQMAVMANGWAQAWTETLLKADAGEFNNYCIAHGVEHLRSALERKKGVILAHSHTVFAQLFWRWLEHQDVREGVTLWQWSWNRSRKEKEDPKIRAIESAREMLAASRELRAGGIVHSMADGRWGGDRTPVPFHGRMRVFQPSFAELADVTGSPVHPVDVILQPDGRIRIDIGDRFAPGPKVKDRGARVTTLVDAYARHLAERWRRHAGNLEWFQIKRHLDAPKPGRQES